MNQSILLVSPQTEHISAVCKTLTRFGMSVFQAECVDNMKAGLVLNSPAFVLIDFDMREVEKIFSEFLNYHDFPRPIVMASADFRKSTERISALKLGADICIGKPLDAKEILTVIHVVQRRECWMAQRDCTSHLPRIVHKNLMIDPFRRRVTMLGKVIALTAKEFDILYLLAQHKDSVLTKREIYQIVWKSDVDLGAPIIMDHISSIRRKLGLKSNDTEYIRTVYGIGYCFGSLDDKYDSTGGENVNF